LSRPAVVRDKACGRLAQEPLAALILRQCPKQ
jgi:hypothetical protein